MLNNMTLKTLLQVITHNYGTPPNLSIFLALFARSKTMFWAGDHPFRNVLTVTLPESHAFRSITYVKLKVKPAAK